MLDGGQTQDFHHISGLAQLGAISGTTRDVIVVGVASMDRRNELAVPSDDADLARDYPTHGDTARFRRFLVETVRPFVEARYRTRSERMLMGESLAGLFVVETLLTAPDLFDHYVAVSPSLWWDGGALARASATHLRSHSPAPRTLYLSLANEGGEMQVAVEDLVAGLEAAAPSTLDWIYAPRPHETHATTFHGAALDAWRRIFGEVE